MLQNIYLWHYRVVVLPSLGGYWPEGLPKPPPLLTQPPSFIPSKVDMFTDLDLHQEIINEPFCISYLRLGMQCIEIFVHSLIVKFVPTNVFNLTSKNFQHCCSIHECLHTCMHACMHT